MPKFCPTCGGKLNDANAKFCTTCGATVAGGSTGGGSSTPSYNSTSSSSNFSSNSSGGGSEKSGWVFKPSGLLGSWKQRYMTVSGGSATFYKAQGDVAESTLILRGSHFDPAPYTMKEYALHIEASGNHVYIQALSESDLNDWMGALSRAGSAKRDVQWPGGVKRDPGRLEKPPSVSAKVSKNPASNSQSSGGGGGWAASNSTTISKPEPTKSSWGSSNNSESSSPSKPSWGSASTEAPSSKPSWGAPASNNNSNNSNGKWGNRKNRESQDDISLNSKSKTAWGAPSKPEVRDDSTSSKPSWGGGGNSQPKKPWQKEDSSQSNGDFKPNILNKTEGADMGISLPSNVVKQSNLNYEDFGENYKWANSGGGNKPAPAPAKPANNPTPSWGAPRPSSSNAKSTGWASGGSSSSSSNSSAPTWNSSGGNSSSGGGGGGGERRSEPSGGGGGGSRGAPREEGVLTANEISGPQLVSKPNPIVAKRRFNVDPLETAKPNPSLSLSSPSLPTPSRPKQAPPQTRSLPPNWEEATTENGDVYYYNTVTGESSWEKPGSGGGGNSCCGNVWPSGTLFCGDCGSRFS